VRLPALQCRQNRSSHLTTEPLDCCIMITATWRNCYQLITDSHTSALFKVDCYYCRCVDEQRSDFSGLTDMKIYGTVSWIFLEKSQLSKPSVKEKCKNTFREEVQCVVHTASACCVIVVSAHCSRTVRPCLTAKLNQRVASF
jgi:hypothetical protein